MKVYRVDYVTSDYSDKEYSIFIAATSVQRAADRARRNTGYSGRVKNVSEVHAAVLIAK